MIRSLGLLYNYGCLTRPSFAVTNLQRLCSSAGTGMTKPQGKQIPVEKDNRTFEEQRQDLVKNLEKNCGKECESQKSKQQQPQQHVQQQQQQQHGQQIKHTADNHEKQLSTGEWSKELNQWIDEMDKLWSHDWNRAWRNMFSLVVSRDWRDWEISMRIRLFDLMCFIVLVCFPFHLATTTTTPPHPTPPSISP